MGTSMVQLIPVSELAPGEAATIRNSVIKGVLTRASAELPMPMDKLVVRDIRAASDILLYSKGAVHSTIEDWSCVTGATTGAYETMATGNNADQRWIAIFGVMTSAELSCTALRFNIGGSDRVIWQLQNLKPGDDDNMVGFCPSGIVIYPNSPYTISRWVMVGSAPAFILLKGVVIEPRGKVISP
jgi:hypothetical protein